MKLSAKIVQEMLGVADDVIIAHGYTFDRMTVDVYFQNGNLVRDERNFGDDSVNCLESTDFEPSYFMNQIKRWYLGNQEPDKGLNSKLQGLFETFGNPLPTTLGGNYSNY